MRSRVVKDKNITCTALVSSQKPLACNILHVSFNLHVGQHEVMHAPR